MDHSLIAIITVTFALAGFVKGVTGMGLPTVAMGVLGALISPVMAASLLLVPSFVTNVWQLLTGRNPASLYLRFWPMMLAIFVTTILASSFLSTGHEWTRMALGVVLILYALFTLVAPQLHIPSDAETLLGPLTGMVTGMITGATGVFVIPAVPYLQSLGLAKDDLVQALGLSFTVSTIALAIGLTGSGAFLPDALWVSVLAVIPALIGMWGGQRMRNRISPQTFRKAFLICLLLLGCELALRPLL
ncbi:sulfite exporter TauE/SafE family protein [Limoniibacter endophyticus]|uniref:Probable membrane transporter protein n=1 Tax=Limoniibacter endophyticus TaxID=1565040 RepID=A0A8J3DML0_9HYPH|nr:sulfite exporter TauE/SafE family protein [Limoniibacter endophyticus]GHC67822.1 membrane protein [Limoniibacter endophyticus]